MEKFWVCVDILRQLVLHHWRNQRSHRRWKSNISTTTNRSATMNLLFNPLSLRLEKWTIFTFLHSSTMHTVKPSWDVMSLFTAKRVSAITARRSDSSYQETNVSPNFSSCSIMFLNYFRRFAAPIFAVMICKLTTNPNETSGRLKNAICASLACWDINKYWSKFLVSIFWSTFTWAGWCNLMMRSLR